MTTATTEMARLVPPDGRIYVHADALMLTISGNGEIGNLEVRPAHLPCGLGKTCDYYMVNRDNLMITPCPGGSASGVVDGGSPVTSAGSAV